MLIVNRHAVEFFEQVERHIGPCLLDRAADHSEVRPNSQRADFMA